MNQPIACSLSPFDYENRKGLISEVARAALRSREPVAGGARLTFNATGTTEQTLREIIAAEATCCSFLRFDLEPAGDTLRLDVTGPDEAQPIIAELFACASGESPESRGRQGNQRERPDSNRRPPA